MARYDVLSDAFWLEPAQEARIRWDLDVARSQALGCEAGFCKYHLPVSRDSTGKYAVRSMRDHEAVELGERIFCSGLRGWLHLAVGEVPVIRFGDCAHQAKWKRDREAFRDQEARRGSRFSDPDSRRDRMRTALGGEE